MPGGNMAGTNVGTIYFTVEAQTAELLSSNKVMDQSIDKTANSFKKLDTQVTKTAKAVNSSLSGVGRGAGQAGIQIQQFIGQVQGGQSAMLALSQQSADLGFVLGAPLLGAVVAITASLAGMLLPSLFDTTDSAETLEKVMKSLDKVVTESQSGVNVLSNEYAKLAKQNKILAEATAISQLKNVQNGLDAITNQIAETTEGFEGFFGEIENANFEELYDYVNKAGNSIENLNDTFYAQDGLIFAQKATKELQEQLDITAEEALNLGLSMQKVSQNGGVDAIQELGGKLTNLAKDKGPKASQALVDLQLKIQTLADNSVTLAEKQKILQDIINGVTTASEDQSNSAEDLSRKYEVMVKSLESQADTLGMTRSELLKYNKELAVNQARLDKQDDGVINSIETSYDRQIAYAQEIEKSKALAAAKRDEAKAEKESQAASKDFINNFKLDGEDEVMDASNPESQATGISQAIVKENQTLLEELENQRGMIQLYQELEVGDAEAHAEALAIIDKRITSEKEKAIQEQSKAQQAAMQAQLGIYNQLFGGMQEMTSNVLASMDEQSDGYKVMFAIQKAFAVAQAIVSAESAAAQILAHDAGILGMGAVATSNVIRSIGYASAGVIAGTAISGARQYGGPVNANGMYRINENGAPEIFNAANGQQYMLPNTRGEVVSNKDAIARQAIVPNPISSYTRKTGDSNTGNQTTIDVENNISITIASDGTTTTSGDSPQLAGLAEKISGFVKVEVKKEFAQSMKQGGALWKAKQKR